MKPHLTTSASPPISSLRGSVSSAARSQSTPAGSWKAPTRFLPSAVLMPVLPPTAASTIAEQRGRHVHDPDAAQPGRRDEAGQVGGRAAADVDDGVGAGEAGLPEHLPAERRDRRELGLLAVRDLDAVRPRSPGAARSVADRLAGARPARAGGSPRPGARPRRAAPGSSPSRPVPTTTSYGAAPPTVQHGAVRSRVAPAVALAGLDQPATSSATSSGVRPSVSTVTRGDLGVDRRAARRAAP